MKTKFISNFFSFLAVSLTPLINIYSRISPRIFGKIWNGPNGILRGPVYTDYEKNLMSKISCQTPFKVIFTNLGLQLLYPLFEPLLLIFTSVGPGQSLLEAAGSSQSRLEAAGSSQSRLEAAGSSQSRLEAAGSSQSRLGVLCADVLFICGRWGRPVSRLLVSGPAPASFPAGGADRAQPLLQLGYSPLILDKS